MVVEKKSTNKIIVFDDIITLQSDCVAQLVEHWIPNPKAVGSSPAAVTILHREKDPNACLSSYKYSAYKHIPFQIMIGFLYIIVSNGWFISLLVFG